MKIVSRVAILVLITAIFFGCSTAGSVGIMGRNEGLRAMCAEGCLEYREDASGCARFHDSASRSCAEYFETLCEAAPTQCVNVSGGLDILEIEEGDIEYRDEKGQTVVGFGSNYKGRRTIETASATIASSIITSNIKDRFSHLPT